MPSVQLETYLQARADGQSVEDACEQSGIGLGEALLHEKDIESGELPLPRARAHARTRGTTNFPAKIIPENIPEGEAAVARDNETTTFTGITGEDIAKPATDTGQRLKLFIERAERLDAEIKDLNSDKSELFKEMKSNGFDTPTIKRIIKLRKMETHHRQEAAALIETYLNAIGMTPIEHAIAMAA